MLYLNQISLTTAAQSLDELCEKLNEIISFVVLMLKREKLPYLYKEIKCEGSIMMWKLKLNPIFYIVIIIIQYQMLNWSLIYIFLHVILKLKPNFHGKGATGGSWRTGVSI